MAKRAAKKPKQIPLIANLKIKALEDVATEYASIRDERIALNEQEAELKKKTLGLMKKYDKRTYSHDGIEIWIPDAEETVKVRIHKKTDEESGAEADA